MPAIKSSVAIAAVLASVALGACSYRPLYGKGDGQASVSAELATVSIAEQKTRAGQIVRNELISSFGNSGRENRYLLKLDITEKDQTVSSQAGQKVDRHRYRLTVGYQLVDLRSGGEASRGTSFSTVSYDTVEEPIADLRAAESARERAARELAQDLRLRVSAFLATKSG